MSRVDSELIVTELSSHNGTQRCDPRRALAIASLLSDFTSDGRLYKVWVKNICAVFWCTNLQLYDYIMT